MEMLSRDEFLRLRPELLNEKLLPFCAMRPELQEVMPGRCQTRYLERLEAGGWVKPSTCCGMADAGNTHRVWRIDPNWEGPDAPPAKKLPEVDGDLYNPDTLKALQNPDRIDTGDAPASWKRAFEKACNTGAKWTCRPGEAYFPNRWGGNRWHKDQQLRLDPDWTPPGLPETDGDLYNPDTLAALKNGAKIPWPGKDKAPASWVRDFKAAALLGADWISGGGDYFSCGGDAPEFDGRPLKTCYRLAPDWQPPAKPKFIDIPVELRNSLYRSTDPEGDSYILTVIPVHPKFLGFVDKKGLVGNTLAYVFADGGFKLVAPAAVRFCI